MTNSANEAGVGEKEFAEVMKELNELMENPASPQKWSIQFWDPDCQEWQFDDNHEPCSKFGAEDDLRQAKRRMGGRWRIAKW